MTWRSNVLGGEREGTKGGLVSVSWVTEDNDGL